MKADQSDWYNDTMIPRYNIQSTFGWKLNSFHNFARSPEVRQSQRPAGPGQPVHGPPTLLYYKLLIIGSICLMSPSPGWLTNGRLRWLWRHATTPICVSGVVDNSNSKLLKFCPLLHFFQAIWLIHGLPRHCRHPAYGRARPPPGKL